jgi:hypothetical protein
MAELVRRDPFSAGDLLTDAVEPLVGAVRVPWLRAVRCLGSGEHVGVVAQAASGDQSPLYSPLAVRPEDADGLEVEGQALVVRR